MGQAPLPLSLPTADCAAQAEKKKMLWKIVQLFCNLLVKGIARLDSLVWLSGITQLPASRPASTPTPTSTSTSSSRRQSLFLKRKFIRFSDLDGAAERWKTEKESRGKRKTEDYIYPRRPSQVILLPVNSCRKLLLFVFSSGQGGPSVAGPPSGQKYLKRFQWINVGPWENLLCSLKCLFNCI